MKTMVGLQSLLLLAQLNQERFARGQMFFYLGIGLFVLAFLVIIVGVIVQVRKNKAINQDIEAEQNVQKNGLSSEPSDQKMDEESK